VTCLPGAYETLEDAVLAFELDSEGVSWCLIDSREKDQAPFVLRGVVEGSRLRWTSVR
jgi:hypothetical protein